MEHAKKNVFHMVMMFYELAHETVVPVETSDLILGAPAGRALPFRWGHGPP